MYERILPAQKMPKNLYSQGSKLMKLAINPDEVQQLIQCGTGFSIKFAPKGNGKHLPDARAKKVVELLEQNYPEIKEQSKNQSEFLGNLINHFKKILPKDISHKTFAAKVLNTLSKNPEITEEIKFLRSQIYA